ncbi:MAG: glycosyltransferase family 4 protein [Ignisphaera sp.]
MRIVVFSELFYPHGSGAELATWLYSNLLVEKGFKVTVVTRQFPGETSIETPINGMKIIRVPMRLAFGSRYDTLINTGTLISPFIKRLIKESDVIYIPGSWYSIIPIAKMYRKRVIIHVHNYSIVCPTSLMYDFINLKVGSSSLRSFMLHEYIERKRRTLSVVASCFLNEFFGKHFNRLGRLADALIFVSKKQRELVLSRVPSLRDKSYVIYNPIPSRPFVETQQNGVGYLGGRSFVKGLHVLMLALRILKGDGLEVYLTKLSEEPRKYKMSNGISINLLPKINLKDLVGLMSKISIIVIPSLWPEPLPYTLIESMLYGKLIIASNIGGIPEIVSNSLAGVKLVEPGNYVAIADALDYFLTFKLEEINEMGIKNREYILKKFNNEESLNRFIKILTKIVT